jgi:long-chain acyl-CoA synthetase
MIPHEIARRRPTHPATILDSEILTYADLDRAANQVANSLTNLGVERSDRVAMMIPNVPQFLCVFFGVLRVGARAVPLHFLSKAAEVEQYLRDSGAVALITMDSFVNETQLGFSRVASCRSLVVIESGEGVRLPEESASYIDLLAHSSPTFETAWVSPDDIGSILYTSGTSDHPKGASFTHFGMLRHAMDPAGENLGVTPDSVVLAALPFCFSFGLLAVLGATVYAGGTLTLLPRFDVGKMLSVIERDRVDILVGSPAMLAASLRHPDRHKYDLRSLRFIGVGGAATSPDLIRQSERLFGLTPSDRYGTTETGVICVNPRGVRPKPGSVGKPAWGVDLRIVDDDTDVPIGARGEVVVRTVSMMTGYHGRPQETKEALRGGWFYTGDIGSVDEAGYLYLWDRKTDMINRGGTKISPIEVETVIGEHPAVQEVAVVGVTDEAMGEEIKAIVVLRQGRQATIGDITEFARERLAPFKCPRFVEFRDSLPRNRLGKISRRDLRK